MKIFFECSNGGLQSQLEDRDYVDDICIMAFTFSDVHYKIYMIQSSAARVGLKMNTPETKNMRINKTSCKPHVLIDRPLGMYYLGDIPQRTHQMISPELL